ncbi:hypothetical protein ACWD0A_03015 [Streptomyces sp. NPDC002867]
METAITVSVIIAMILIGVLLIHLLNGQHAERIAAFHYGEVVPGIGRRRRKSRRPAERAGSSVTPAHPVAAAHREDREGAADDA